MANMIDYLVWRGELTLEASPWNEVDGLLLATLSYLNFHGIQHPKGWTLEELKRLDAVIPSTSSSYPLRKQAFEGMADSIRFGMAERAAQQARERLAAGEDPMAVIDGTLIPALVMFIGFIIIVNETHIGDHFTD